MASEPKVMVMWGANAAHTGGSFNKVDRYDMNRCLANGMKMIVIDPKDIEIWPEKHMRASDCDYWLRPRPNSDGILAMGFIKVIVDEGLYDEDYIRDWTIGFDKIVAETKKYTLEDVERLTWVPKQDIVEAARLIATEWPCAIANGNGLEGNVSAFQALRAICILRGIIGSVNTPKGAFCELDCADYRRTGSFMIGEMKDVFKDYPRIPKRTIGGIESGMAARFGYVPVQSLVRALLEGEPYTPKVGIGFVNNPLLTYPDSRAVEEAFKKFELLVFSELFPTATTRVCDIVLPAAFMHEHDTLAYWPAWHGGMRANVELVPPPGEAWSDMKFINELAKRVGLEKYFPWENEEQILDYMLEPSGLTWKQMRDEVHFVGEKWLYDPDKVIGYNTPSGKVELECETLTKYFADTVPTFEKLAKPLQGIFDMTADYPLIFTNYKSEIFMASGYRSVERLLKKSLPPTAYLSPETANEFGIEEGDWIWIETYRGRMKQQARLQEGIHPKVVNVEFGWGDWIYPDSNMNLITDYRKPWDYESGSVTIRGYACKIYKAAEEEDGNGHDA
jgi:thiosulfate reductase / polysulfide reductase chain A